MHAFLPILATPGRDLELLTSLNELLSISSLLSAMSLFFMDIFRPGWTIDVFKIKRGEALLSHSFCIMYHAGRGNEGSVDSQSLMDKEIWEDTATWTSPELVMSPNPKGSTHRTHSKTKH